MVAPSTGSGSGQADGTDATYGSDGTYACTPEAVDAVMGERAAFEEPRGDGVRWYGQINGNEERYGVFRYHPPLASAFGDTLAECSANLRAAVMRCWESICREIGKEGSR